MRFQPLRLFVAALACCLLTSLLGFAQGSGGAAGATNPGHRSDVVHCVISTQLKPRFLTEGCATPTVLSFLSSPSITVGSSVTDEGEVTGSDGIPTGTVQFYVCGPDTAPVSCTSPTDPVGGAEELGEVDGVAVANSPAFTPTSAGTWCFAVSYSGDNTYTSGSDTSTDNECVTVTPPSSVTLTCQANQECTGSVSANSVTAVVSGTSSTAATFSLSMVKEKVNCGNGFQKPAEYLNLAQSGFTGTSFTVTLSADQSITGSCFSSLVPFVDQEGKTVKTGLLPTCSQVSNTPPCVVSIESSDQLGSSQSGRQEFPRTSDSSIKTNLPPPDCPSHKSSKGPLSASAKNKRMCMQGLQPPV